MLSILFVGMTVSLSSQASAMPVIDVVEVFNVDGLGNHAIDIFYTPSDGLEFNAWDLIVTPTTGSLLDPDPSSRSDNTTDGAAVDTFGNTVFSSLGASAASHFFAAYHPGQAFPPILQDPLPTADGDPNRLEWTMFDTFVCDGNCSFFRDFVPLHMGRVIYEAGGRGTFEVRFFENGATPAIPTVVTGNYGIPEPSTFTLGGLVVMSLFASRHVKLRDKAVG